jgi:hypothetical protein
MKKNLPSEAILSIMLTLMTLVTLFVIADATRFYALTYDGVRYLFESHIERGIHYAFSLESYFYRFFIFQSGKFFSTFTSLQNFHFCLFIIIFVQANYLFYKYLGYKSVIALNILMLLNLYANGLIFVVERETILSFLTFGFFSFTIPIFLKKINLVQYIFLMIYATLAPLIKLEGSLLLLAIIALNFFINIPKKIKFLAITFSLLSIFSFNFIFTHHGLKEARGNYFSTVLIRPLAYILSKKNISGTLNKEDLENITQIYNKESLILKENIHNVPVINIYYKKKIHHIDKKFSLELSTIPLIIENFDLLIEVSWMNFVSSLDSFFPHGYTLKSFFFNDGYNDPYIDYHFLKTTIENLKENINKNIYKFTEATHLFYKTSGIYYLFTTPMSFILNFVLLLLFSINRRWDFFSLFLAFLVMNLGVILFAPNDNARYYYHLVFINPLLWIFTYINVKKLKENLIK